MAAISASSADDVCPDVADPCIITERIRVAPGSTLDFGLRHVRVERGGFLDFRGSATLAAGGLSVEGPGRKGIKIRNEAYVLLEAYRTCTGSGRACIFDEECGTGLCTVGDGSVSIHADIDGRTVGLLGNFLDVRSAGATSIRGRVDLRGGGVQEGGLLAFWTAGAVRIDGPVLCGGGGRVEIGAGSDVVIAGDIECPGGEAFGEIDIESAGDVSITGAIDLSSHGKSGVGGEVYVHAGRDLVFGDPQAETEQEVRLDGSVGLDGAYAGFVSLDAGANLRVHPNVRFLARAPGRMGEGPWLDFAAAGDVHLYGDMDLRGSFSLVTVDAAGDVVIGPDARIAAATGRKPIASTLYVLSREADVTFQGSVDVQGGGTVNGRGGTTTLEGCNVLVDGAAWLQNSVEGGGNVLIARETATVTAAARIHATGRNDVTYRNEPPHLLGAFEPAPIVTKDESLTPCGR